MKPLVDQIGKEYVIAEDQPCHVCRLPGHLSDQCPVSTRPREKEEMPQTKMCIPSQCTKA